MNTIFIEVNEAPWFYVFLLVEFQQIRIRQSSFSVGHLKT